MCLCTVMCDVNRGNAIGNCDMQQHSQIHTHTHTPQAVKEEENYFLDENGIWIVIITFLDAADISDLWPLSISLPRFSSASPPISDCRRWPKNIHRSLCSHSAWFVMINSFLCHTLCVVEYLVNRCPFLCFCCFCESFVVVCALTHEQQIYFRQRKSPENSANDRIRNIRRLAVSNTLLNY